MSTVRRVAVAAAALAVGASLASCQYLASNYPNVVPTPAPTATSTPAETDMQRQMRTDYEAAQKTYQTSVVEADKLLESGATEPSAAFRAVATGEYADLVMGLARQLRQAGYTSTGRTVVRGVIEGGYKEKNIILIACEDVSGVRYAKNGKQAKTNSKPYYVQRYTVTKTDAKSWKVSKVVTTQLESLEGQPCVTT